MGATTTERTAATSITQYKCELGHDSQPLLSHESDYCQKVSLDMNVNVRGDPKPSFQMKVNFVFYFGNWCPNSQWKKSETAVQSAAHSSFLFYYYYFLWFCGRSDLYLKEDSLEIKKKVKEEMQ